MDDCVNWKGGTFAKGRPQVILGYENGRTLIFYAARVFYTLYNSAIPPGHQVHHVCRNPICVNPRHLQALTHKEHAAIHAADKAEVCANGHPRAEHSYKTRRGNRCRKCDQASQQKHRDKWIAYKRERRRLARI